jgi:glycerophosphoryl diester phosphodiesterase
MSRGAVLQTETTVVIAHRGASAYAPEHTLAAYDLALQLGADYIEQDLQMTRDGVLIVMHDDTLNRTARGVGCTGRVILRTREELRTCSAGRWFGPDFENEGIPTLEEVLARYCGRARFYIETKNPDEAPGMEKALVSLLNRHGLLATPDAGSLPGVIIQSFSADSLRQIAELAPALPRVQLIAKIHSTRIIAQLGEITRYAHGIGPSRRSVDTALMAAAHSHNLAVHPYTVNGEAEMRRLLALGVDGMFTDRPDRLIALR